MGFNDSQVGGNHYRKVEGEQHWDRVDRLKLDYFQAQITKYVERCWDKNGVEDLEKAQHFLGKYIELSKNWTYPSGEKGVRRGDQQALRELLIGQVKEERDLFEARMHYLLQNEVVTETGQYQFPFEDGLHHSPFDEDAPVPCLRGGNNDFEPEGVYGNGKAMWTCKHCRSKVYTTPSQRVPHAAHQPGGPACQQAMADRVAQDSRNAFVGGRSLEISGSGAKHPPVHVGAQFADALEPIDGVSKAETHVKDVVQEDATMLETRLRVSSLLAAVRTNNRKAARAIFEKHSIGEPPQVPDANLAKLEADLKAHMATLAFFVSQGDDAAVDNPPI